MPVSEITNLTGLPRRTINRWYGRYLHLGLSGFVDNRRGGNHKYLTEEQIQDLEMKLKQYRPVDLLGLEKVRHDRWVALDCAGLETSGEAMV